MYTTQTWSSNFACKSCSHLQNNSNKLFFQCLLLVLLSITNCLHARLFALNYLITFLFVLIICLLCIAIGIFFNKKKTVLFINKKRKVSQPVGYTSCLVDDGDLSGSGLADREVNSLMECHFHYLTKKIALTEAIPVTPV